MDLSFDVMCKKENGTYRFSPEKLPKKVENMSEIADFIELCKKFQEEMADTRFKIMSGKEKKITLDDFINVKIDILDFLDDKKSWFIEQYEQYTVDNPNPKHKAIADILKDIKIDDLELINFDNIQTTIEALESIDKDSSDIEEKIKEIKNSYNQGKEIADFTILPENCSEIDNDNISNYIRTYNDSSKKAKDELNKRKKKQQEQQKEQQKGNQRQPGKGNKTTSGSSQGKRKTGNGSTKSEEELKKEAAEINEKLEESLRRSKILLQEQEMYCRIMVKKCVDEKSKDGKINGRTVDNDFYNEILRKLKEQMKNDKNISLDEVQSEIMKIINDRIQEKTEEKKGHESNDSGENTSNGSTGEHHAGDGTGESKENGTNGSGTEEGKENGTKNGDTEEGKENGTNGDGTDSKGKKEYTISIKDGNIILKKGDELLKEISLEEAIPEKRSDRKASFNAVKSLLWEGKEPKGIKFKDGKYNIAIIKLIQEILSTKDFTFSDEELKGIFRAYLLKGKEDEDLGFEYSAKKIDDGYTISDKQFRVLNRGLVSDERDFGFEQGELGGIPHLGRKQFFYKFFGTKTKTALPQSKQSQELSKKGEEEYNAVKLEVEEMKKGLVIIDGDDLQKKINKYINTKNELKRPSLGEDETEYNRQLDGLTCVIELLKKKKEYFEKYKIKTIDTSPEEMEYLSSIYELEGKLCKLKFEKVRFR